MGLNAVCPGEIAKHRRAASSPTRPVPLAWLGEPEEVADAVAFPVSHQAVFLTARAINVCGGLELR